MALLLQYSPFSAIYFLCSQRFKFAYCILYMETLEKNETIAAPITFTEGALEELHRLKTSLVTEDESYLRIGVKGGGCSGLSYLLAFDKKEDADKVFDIQGISVVMNKAHIMYVLGMRIDWENGLNNRGFTFNNPNAQETCGCGQSFSTKV
jgi:iron-sulfur cluster assembly protein